MRDEKLQKLKGEIRLAFDNILPDTNKKDKFFEILVSRGFLYGQINGLLEDNITLDILNENQLGFIAIILEEQLGFKNINYEKYFNDLEIEKLKVYKIEKVIKTLEYPIVMKGVTKVNEKQWNFVASANWIKLMMDSGLLKYNMNTQREPTQVITSSNDVVSLATVNWKAVDEIAHAIQTNVFVPNTLTFNIKSNSKFNFNTRETLDKIDIGTFELNNGYFDIIDGYHRTLAIMQNVNERELDMNFEIRIVDFSEEEARQFIIQEDKRNPIDKTYIRSINNTDRIRNIVDKLNKSSNSELRAKIVLSRNALNKGIGYYTFESIYNIINRYWEVNNLMEEDEVVEYLQEFFKYMVGYNYDKFDSSSKYQYTDSKMLVLLMAVAHKLQGRSNLKEEIAKVSKILDKEIEDIYKKMDKFSMADAVYVKKGFMEVINEIVEVF